MLLDMEIFCYLRRHYRGTEKKERTLNVRLYAELPYIMVPALGELVVWWEGKVCKWGVRKH